MEDTTRYPQEYRGFEITAPISQRGQVCPLFVQRLRRPARDLAHAQEIIDAHHAAAPRQPGELRVVAADVRVVHGLSASACRNRSEQATGRRRVGGKFAVEGGAR